MTLSLPLWAILYSGVILASAAGTIMISKRKHPFYVIAELLSGFFSVTFFLIYYGVIPYPSSLTIPILMLGFILFQEMWINRSLYGFLKMEDTSPQERQFTLFFSAFFMLLFLAPFIWIVSEVFKHYL